MENCEKKISLYRDMDKVFISYEEEKDIVEKFENNTLKLEKVYTEKKSNSMFIAVMGAMKSGKSTFLNSLIGEEVLPSENEACTISPIYIDTRENSCNIEKVYLNNKIELIQEKNDIYTTLLEDVRQYRKSIKNNGDAKIKSYKLSKKLDNIVDVEGYKLEFIDTPGINEAQNNSKIKELMEEQFNDIVRKSCLIIYVLDIQYFKSNENVEILTKMLSIDRQIKDKILFIMNKEDDFKEDKRVNIETLIDDAKKTLDNIGYNNIDIYTVSSILALSGKMLRKCLPICDDINKMNFLMKLFNHQNIKQTKMNNELWTQIYEKNKSYIEPYIDNKEVNINGEILLKKPPKKDIVDQLIEKSKVRVVEDIINKNIKDKIINFEKKQLNQIMNIQQENDLIIENIIKKNNDIMDKKQYEKTINIINKIKSFKDDVLNEVYDNDNYKIDIDKIMNNLSYIYIQDQNINYNVFSNYVHDNWIDPKKIKTNVLRDGKIVEVRRHDSLNEYADKCVDEYLNSINKLANSLYEYRSKVVLQAVNEIKGRINTNLKDMLRNSVDKLYELVNIKKRQSLINDFVFSGYQLKDIHFNNINPPKVESRTMKKQKGFIFTKEITYVEQRISENEVKSFVEKCKYNISYIVNNVNNEIRKIFIDELKESINKFVYGELEFICKDFNDILDKKILVAENEIKNFNIAQQYDFDMKKVLGRESGEFDKRKLKNMNSLNSSKTQSTLTYEECQEVFEEIFGELAQGLDDDNVRKLTGCFGKELTRRDLAIGFKNKDKYILNIIAKIYYSFKIYIKAVNYFKMAAQNGSDEARLNLGLMYLKGTGIEKDEKKAIILFKEAAENNYVRAQNELGILYNDGSTRELGKNNTEAIKWFKRAAELGYVDSQRNLAALYYNGMGTDKDYMLALKWFEKAAEQKEIYSQYMTGSMYYFGTGTDKNIGMAIKWYTLAADSGDVSSQFYLGYIYSQDEYGEYLNYSQSAKWYELAVKQGHDMAANNLGELYREGKGVKIDYKKAFDLYNIAIAKNNKYACYNMGEMYELGQGVETNLQEALKWYKLADKYEYEPAKEKIIKLTQFI